MPVTSPTYLTLEYAGEEKPFADWGIAREGAACHRLNLRTHTYQFSVPGGNLGDDLLFPFLGKIIIRRNRTREPGPHVTFTGGYIAFQGYRFDTIIEGRPQFEGVHYQFGNAWGLLENTPFQQSSAAWIVDHVGWQFTSGLSLFLKISEGHAVDPYEADDGHGAGILWKISNGHQINEVFRHALKGYADSYAVDPARFQQFATPPFQVGVIDPNLFPPFYPMQEISCADAIVKCLELSPDCTVVWDETTTPPTVSVRKRANLSPVTLTLKNGVDHKSLRLVPKPALQPSVVIIYFKITSFETVGGETRSYVTYLRAKYGPHGYNSALDPDGGLYALVNTIDPAGPDSSVLQSRLVCPPIYLRDCLSSTDANLPAVRGWWASVKPELASRQIRQLNIFDTSIEDDDTGDVLALGNAQLASFLFAWPRRLKDGTIHSWMNNGGVPVTGRRVKIRARIVYDRYNMDGNGSELDTSGIIVESNKDDVEGKEISAELTVTNAVTGLYSITDSVTPGETVPGELAKDIWDGLAQLQYEGDHIRVEQIISQQIGMANTMNLDCGVPGHAWLTMAAQIQGITEDDSNGEVSVTVGPARHLNSGDLNAIFQFNRWRRTWQNPNTMQTGQP